MFLFKVQYVLIQFYYLLTKFDMDTFLIQRLISIVETYYINDTVCQSRSCTFYEYQAF